jgi:hypothetical protein
MLATRASPVRDCSRLSTSEHECTHRAGDIRYINDGGTWFAPAEGPMIRANCRDRFTAADFDFVVRTLSRSPGESITLATLLTDADSRNSILDHELLVQAILAQPVHLSISPQFYFYVLIRHALKSAGMTDRGIADYVASMLEAFSRTARLRSPADPAGKPTQYISDLLLALQGANSLQTFLIRAHVGNYSLFLSGIFHENVQHRTSRGAPDIEFYEQMGSQNFRAVVDHTVARSCELSRIFDDLSRHFHEVRRALNRVADSMLSLEEQPPDGLC